MCRNTTVNPLNKLLSFSLDVLCLLPTFYAMFSLYCARHKGLHLFFCLCLEQQLFITDLPGNVSQIQTEIVFTSGSANKLTAGILNAVACRVSADLDGSNCLQLLSDCQNHLFLRLMVNFQGNAIVDKKVDFSKAQMVVRHLTAICFFENPAQLRQVAWQTDV